MPWFLERDVNLRKNSSPTSPVVVHGPDPGLGAGWQLALAEALDREVGKQVPEKGKLLGKSRSRACARGPEPTASAGENSF